MHTLPIDASGRFAGYASVFGTLDDGGDIVMPGAFARSLAARGRDGVRMLFQHDPKEPVGTWERLVEDGFGLRVEGRLIGGVPRADALRRLIASGAIDGLSIGFRTVRATRDPRSRHRRLWQIDLWEISIVTFPMLAGARISAGGRLAPAPDGRLLRSLDAAISALKTS
ncbi:MAG: HK97 family phage prohead protease [Devosia sp.]